MYGPVAIQNPANRSVAGEEGLEVEAQDIGGVLDAAARDTGRVQNPADRSVEEVARDTGRVQYPANRSVLGE